MIKGIFFDFDGTICDTRRLISEESVKVLEKASYEIDKSNLAKYLGVRFEHFAEMFGVSEKEINRLRKMFYKNLINRAKKEMLYPCLDLKPLKKLNKKYLMIVVSNAESKFTKTCAKRLKVDKIFKEIHGAEGFKTKDEILKKLFKKFNFKPKEVLYVGDRFSDVEYAKKAKCLSVAIHNNCSWSTMDKILEKNPDYIIGDFYDLEELVEKINKLKI